MYAQDWFVRYYDYRPFRSILLNKIVGNTSKIAGIVGKRILPLWFKWFPGKRSTKLADVDVCMTSFPARIPNVWIVLESVLRQRVQPRKVYLYLAGVQFENKEDVEKTLQQYVEMGLLEIKWVEEDYRSYKKFWFFLKEYPDRDFITMDDDIIYESTIISHLVSEAQKGERVIPACYCYKITRDIIGNLKSYSTWSKQTNSGDEGAEIFFGSGGGAYFPAGSLEGADADYSIIKQVCPLADDIWLNAFVRKNGYTVRCVKDRRSVFETRNDQIESLSKQNLSLGKNDIQMLSVNKFFIENYGRMPFMNSL